MNLLENFETSKSSPVNVTKLSLKTIPRNVIDCNSYLFLFNCNVIFTIDSLQHKFVNSMDYINVSFCYIRGYGGRRNLLPRKRIPSLMIALLTSDGSLSENSVI